jgi:hypothetical protein
LFNNYVTIGGSLKNRCETKGSDLLERFIIFGSGRREITPEEIEEHKSFIKSLQEKEVVEKKSIDELISLTKAITTKMEPLKELPKLPETQRHWTPRNWKNQKPK